MNRIENVYDVTQRLCGLIEPQGETTIDEIRFLNLQDTISLTEKLIDDIESVARHSNRSEYSMSKAGKEANEFIKLLRERFQ